MRLFLTLLAAAFALSGCQAGERQRYYVDYAYYMVETDPELMRDAERAGGGRQEAYCFAKALALDMYGAADYALLSDVVAFRGEPTRQDRARVEASELAYKAKAVADKPAAHRHLDGIWQRCLSKG